MQSMIYLYEQCQRSRPKNLPLDLHVVSNAAIRQKEYFYKPANFCFQLCLEGDNVFFETSYFVGVDWLVPKQLPLYVEPKLNGATQVNFMQLLFSSLDTPENLEHLEGLFHAEYDEAWISIPEQKDILSPVLIVQFLKLLREIVRKGLHKSYHRIIDNLNSRVKGKIIVGRQIKQNVANNRLTRTICNYQEYGINTKENQFLKLVLNFISTFLNRERSYFNIKQHGDLKEILNY